MKISRTCVLCKKTIKKFAKWNDDKIRSVHRSCWLNFRDSGDRHYDYLFCPDRKFNSNNKNTIIKPAEKSEPIQIPVEEEDATIFKFEI